MVPSVHWNPHDPGTQLRTTCGVHAPHMESKRDKIRNISWNKSHISSHIIVSNESWNSMLYDELMQFVMGLAILSIPHWSSFVLSPLYIIRRLTTVNIFQESVTHSNGETCQWTRTATKFGTLCIHVRALRLPGMPIPRLASIIWQKEHGFIDVYCTLR